MQASHPTPTAPKTILAQLHERGITVSVEGGELRFNGPAGSLTPDLKAAITEHGAGLVAELTGYQPLDRDIIRHESRKPKNTMDEIRARLAHCRQVAATPGATPLHHQLVRDWELIAREKDTQRHAAGRTA